MAEKKKTPARKKRTMPRQKKRRWLFPKFLLIMGCLALLGFIGVVMFLEKEARRMGIFEPEVTQDVAPAGKTLAREAAQAPGEEDYTPEEKQQLDAILESGGGQ